MDHHTWHTPLLLARAQKDSVGKKVTKRADACCYLVDCSFGTWLYDPKEKEFHDHKNKRGKKKTEAADGSPRRPHFGCRVLTLAALPGHDWSENKTPSQWAEREAWERGKVWAASRWTWCPHTQTAAAVLVAPSSHGGRWRQLRASHFATHGTSHGWVGGPCLYKPQWTGAVFITIHSRALQFASFYFELSFLSNKCFTKMASSVLSNVEEEQPISRTYQYRKVCFSKLFFVFSFILFCHLIWRLNVFFFLI